jgi:hypothetical protein
MREPDLSALYFLGDGIFLLFSGAKGFEIHSSLVTSDLADHLQISRLWS